VYTPPFTSRELESDLGSLSLFFEDEAAVRKTGRTLSRERENCDWREPTSKGPSNSLGRQ